jgi:hypothetical protein
MTLPALDQTVTDVLLECRDLLADRRLREHRPQGRAAERALLGNRSQRQQVPELDAKPVSIDARRGGAVGAICFSG